MPEYLAVDLGAGSGRLMRGIISGDRLSLEETGRFPNNMVSVNGHLHWNILGLFSDIKCAMASAADASKPESIGVDTWGVDFVLLDRDGMPAGLPVAYRDSRTDGMMEKFFELVPRSTVYRKTGIQLLQINTLFQLFAMSQQKAPALEIADALLMMPDFINYLFTGEKCTEFTDATTSQLLGVADASWDADLIAAAGVRPEIFQRIVRPGTVIGNLTKSLQADTGLGGIKVIAPATHDTGSAVAAVPAEGDDWAYISSGTWSLMGIEIRNAIVSEEAERFNFTNEGGVDNTYRFLKNLMGLWTVQRIHAELEGKLNFSKLTQLASEAPAFRCFIDVEDIRFNNPPSMMDAIAGFCKETGQRAPDSPGAFVRCSLESLALQCRVVLEQLRAVHSNPINLIHVIGGGSQNKLLCHMTACATKLPVIAGPVEATAMGNIAVQAMALGHIGSLAEARALIKRSCEVAEYAPSDADAWDAALDKYTALKNR